MTSSNTTPLAPSPFKVSVKASCAYLSVPLQRGEVEEERLSQRDAVDGVVQIVALVQLHLVERE